MLYLWIKVRVELIVGLVRLAKASNASLTSVLQRHSRMFRFVSSVKEEDNDLFDVELKWGFM